MALLLVSNEWVGTRENGVWGGLRRETYSHASCRHACGGIGIGTSLTTWFTRRRSIAPTAAGICRIATP
jgi:hypothetical protein